MTPLHIELINVTAPYLIMAALIAALELIKKHIHNPNRRNH
jgi:hypothetical protein